MDLSVIIGVYNEEEIVKESITSLHDALNKFGTNFEIVIVNDGSTDKTEYILKSIKKKLSKVKVVSYKKNQGKGYAIKKGVEAAKGDYILYTDIDLAYPVEQIPKFLAKIKESRADAVFGCRVLPESSYIITPDAFKTVYLRHLTSRAFNFSAGALIGVRANDTQCGIKCFKRDVLRKFTKFQKMHGFSFDVEFLLMAQLNGYQVIQIPVTVKHSVRNSKVRLFRDSFRMFNDLLRIKKYKSQGAYYFNGKI